MVIDQLSVFLENREGRLDQVLQTLKDANININSLSLADTSDYGMLRMIVSDPVKAKDALKANGFSASLTKILAITLNDEVGKLQEVLRALSDADINIEYMYALEADASKASIVIKTEDLDRASKVLEKF